MKKLLLIIVSIYISFLLCGCTPADMPSEDDSLPTVDIVERSELLNMVTIDHIINADTRQMIADMGVTVEMKDFTLTADDRASFYLWYTTKEGHMYHYETPAVIDYTAHKDGSFSNIRFYWGGMTKAGDNLLVTYLDHAILMSLENPPKSFIWFDLSFVEENDAHIVKTVYGFDRYAFIYYSPELCGIAVFDSNGKLISNINAPIKGEGIVGLLGTHTADLVSDIPFSYNDRFSGQFVNSDLFMINLNGWSYPAYHLYNCRDKTVSDLVTHAADNITVNDAEYSVYTIFRQNGADRETGYGGLALRKTNGEYTGAVLFDTKGYSYEKDSKGTLSVTDGGSLVYHSQPTGLQVTVDFESNTFTNEYLITEDMLGEKTATSTDKKFSLYEYGKHPHNNTNISYLALKNEKTGDISYVADYKGRPYREYSLEAGFFSNGDIYLMTDYDFEIFTTDTAETGPIFRLSDNFTLGELREDYYNYNTLCAARRDPNNGSFIIVYDHLNNVKYYGAPSAENSALFDDTYQVSLLDKDGKEVKTFTTGMHVPSYPHPLNIYLKGDVLTMQNVDRDTGKVLQKATLNIKTGKFTQVQQWTSTDK